MAKKIMTDKHKLAAYVLHEELGYKQKAIATLMEVEQPTISNGVKDARSMVKIKRLEKDLQEARDYVKSLGYDSQKSVEILPPNPKKKLDS